MEGRIERPFLDLQLAARDLFDGAEHAEAVRGTPGECLEHEEIESARQQLDDCTNAVPLIVVGEAASGREALALLGTMAADLVLTDIHMPDMDGIELARHLLKLPTPPCSSSPRPITNMR